MENFENFSLSESSEEEEVRIIAPRNFRERTDPFEIYSEEEFKIRFRFSKVTVNELLYMIGENLEPLTRRNHSISSKLQLVVALRYFATGTFQAVMGDSVGIHKSTVSRIVRRVSRRIAGLKETLIQMPRTEQEILDVKKGFYAVARFPGVIGCIDCTHIQIKSPGGDNAELYRNRKGYFSINTQAVCDSSLRIMNIVARWPGSVHDSTIFNNSRLHADLENGLYGAGYLLGDRGYPCKPYLLTPFTNPILPDQQAYNRSHIRTRNTIERCFGVIKRRFPCLSLGLRTSVDTTLTIIVACCVLHNLAINMNDEVPDQEIDYDVEIEPFEAANYEGHNNNFAVRNALLINNFQQ